MNKLNSNSKIIIAKNNYNLGEDKRFLIPFLQGTKIGFANKMGNVVIQPNFQFVLDDFECESSLVRVGEHYVVTYERKTTSPATSIHKRYGILKSNGEFLVPMEYEGIAASFNDFELYFVLRSSSKGYAVIDKSGNIIVPFGVYDYISGYNSMHARVKIYKNENHIIKPYWGIIGYKGEVVLEPKYKVIDDFSHGIHEYVKVISYDDVKHEFHFLDDKLKCNGAFEAEERRWADYDLLEEYTYNEYRGSYAQDVMGYSDQEIDDAFEGDPDAYWNID